MSAQKHVRLSAKLAQMEKERDALDPFKQNDNRTTLEGKIAKLALERNDEVARVRDAVLAKVEAQAAELDARRAERMASDSV